MARRQDRLPIAVFDSGVGGLTVLKAIRRRLPGEDLVYFGDTAHVPYGTKSPGTVRRLTRTHMNFLRKRGVKCTVVACNTASAVALGAAGAGSNVPLVGVIEPGVRAALAATRSGRIGVIGTTTTVASGAYQRQLRRLGRRGLRVFARPCPLFVPLIDEGWASHPVAERIARDYLKPLIRARVDTVILGCTHYPILKPVLRRLLGPRVTLVDSAEAVQRETSRLLADRGLLCRRRRGGRTSFFLTDTGGTFRRVASRFLGERVRRLTEVRVRVEALSDVAVRA